jgi:hypothetical protein
MNESTRILSVPESWLAELQAYQREQQRLAALDNTSGEHDDNWDELANNGSELLAELARFEENKPKIVIGVVVQGGMVSDVVADPEINIKYVLKDFDAFDESDSAAFEFYRAAAEDPDLDHIRSDLLLDVEEPAEYANSEHIAPTYKEQVFCSTDCRGSYIAKHINEGAVVTWEDLDYTPRDKVGSSAACPHCGKNVKGTEHDIEAEETQDPQGQGSGEGDRA